MDKVVLLHNIPLFEGIETDHLVAVAEICERRTFSAGHVVFHEGDQGHHLYLIVHGAAEVLTENVRVAELGAGETFGELALLDGSARSATVRAVTELECLVLARDDFGDLLDVSPSLAKAIVRVLTQRLRNVLEG